MFPFPSLLLKGADAGGGGGSGLSNRWRLNISSTQVNSNYASIAELELRQTVGGANAATGGTASASAEAAGAASNAFDNNTATKWSTGTGTKPQQIEYQFPTSVTIEQIAMTQTTARDDTPNAFTVEYHDGATWQTYWSEPSFIVTTTSTTLTFSRVDPLQPGYTRWRLNITAAKGATSWPAVGEVQWRTSSGGADITSPNSGDGGNPIADVTADAQLAYDNSNASKWSGLSVVPHWIGYRFPTQKDIVEVAITSPPSGVNDSPKTFNVQYYDPATGSWVTSWSVADAGFTTTSQTKVFTKP